MEDLKNLDKLPQEVKNKIVPYSRQLFEMYPNQIRSILIYGSATGRNYLPNHSDINLVIIFNEVGFNHLNKALKVVAKGIKQRIPALLFLTKDYITSSLDVFPVEFLDIKENHVLIFGEDFFSSLNIPSENLRLFCEHEIKGKLIRIRQAYLERGLKGFMVEALLKESLRTLIPIFRNLIRLKNQSVELDKERVIFDLSRIYHLEAQVFLEILKSRTHGLRMPSAKAQEMMEKYILELEKLAKSLDQV